VVVQTGDRVSAQKLTGLLVDEVQEVTTLNGTDVEEAPNFATTLDVTYILGLAKTKDGVTILLDLEKLLGQAKPEFAQ
jgi:chemotaxis signal transduction protein